MSVPPDRRVSLPALSLLIFALAGCGSGSSSSGFDLRTTTQAADASAPLVVTGNWMVYFASEIFTGPAGTDLNTNDSDTTDHVAFAVDLHSSIETNTGVAAQAATIVGSDIYLVVDETLDGFDWNGDGGIDDIVLVHWSSAEPTPVFVDTLDLSSGELPLAEGGRLYYSAQTVFAVVGETNLRVLVPGSTPTIIPNESSPENVRAHLVGKDEGLLFCVVDENENGIDFNADADVIDELLSLLDGTVAAPTLRNVGLAMKDGSAPLDARALGTSHWMVAFLVDELSQGGTNFNDQALFNQPLLPENCSGDTDAFDQVLFFLDIDFASAAALAPVNTGLAGHDRVLLLNGFVATISDELDANCNLNAATGDTDTNDEVARWVATTTPIAPPRAPEQMHALATTIGGGSMGLSVLDNRLVTVIDEEADSSNLDGKVQDHKLVAWLDPAAETMSVPAVWHLSHQSQTTGCCGATPPTPCRFGTGVFDSDCDPEPFAGTSWMAPKQVGDRLGLVFLEEVPGTNPQVGSLNTNLDCALVPKDADKTDGLPVWADFEDGPTLDFDGVGYAVDLANAGIEIAAGFAFFRVSESADNRDYNNDGQLNDVVLFRNPLTSCAPVPMATSSFVVGQAIVTDGVNGAAFFSSESQAGIDFNDDGDTTDLVVRYFSF